MSFRYLIRIQLNSLTKVLIIIGSRMKIRLVLAMFILIFQVMIFWHTSLIIRYLGLAPLNWTGPSCKIILVFTLSMILFILLRLNLIFDKFRFPKCDANPFHRSWIPLSRHRAIIIHNFITAEHARLTLIIANVGLSHCYCGLIILFLGTVFILI